MSLEKFFKINSDWFWSFRFHLSIHSLFFVNMSRFSDWFFNTLIIRSLIHFSLAKMNNEPPTPKTKRHIKNPELRSHLMKEMWRKFRKVEGKPPIKNKPVAKEAKLGKKVEKVKRVKVLE